MLLGRGHARVEARAVVADAQLEGTGPRRKGDSGTGGARVPLHVRERFASDQEELERRRGDEVSELRIGRE